MDKKTFLWIFYPYSVLEASFTPSIFMRFGELSPKLLLSPHEPPKSICCCKALKQGVGFSLVKPRYWGISRSTSDSNIARRICPALATSDPICNNNMCGLLESRKCGSNPSSDIVWLCEMIGLL